VLSEFSRVAIHFTLLLRLCVCVCVCVCVCAEVKTIDF